MEWSIVEEEQRQLMSRGGPEAAERLEQVWGWPGPSIAVLLTRLTDVFSAAVWWMGEKLMRSVWSCAQFWEDTAPGGGGGVEKAFAGQQVSRRGTKQTTSGGRPHTLSARHRTERPNSRRWKH